MNLSYTFWCIGIYMIVSYKEVIRPIKHSDKFPVYSWFVHIYCIMYHNWLVIYLCYTYHKKHSDKFLTYVHILVYVYVCVLSGRSCAKSRQSLMRRPPSRRPIRGRPSGKHIVIICGPAVGIASGRGARHVVIRAIL